MMASKTLHSGCSRECKIARCLLVSNPTPEGGNGPSRQCTPAAAVSCIYTVVYTDVRALLMLSLSAKAGLLRQRLERKEA